VGYVSSLEGNTSKNIIELFNPQIRQKKWIFSNLPGGVVEWMGWVDNIYETGSDKENMTPQPQQKLDVYRYILLLWNGLELEKLSLAK